MRLTAFFKLYKICILLHRCNLKRFAKNLFEKSVIFVKIESKFRKTSANVAERRKSAGEVRQAAALLHREHRAPTGLN